MAKFHLELDKRVKLKNGLFNLGVRIGLGNDNMYLKYVPLTEKQYEDVFVKNAMDTKSVDFREQCLKFKGKCERIYSEMEIFDKAHYRELVYNKVVAVEKKTELLLLTDLCTRYLEEKVQLKLKTRQLCQSAVNSCEEFKPGVTILDITPLFLKNYEQSKREKDYSQATISAYLRHLCGIINYFIYETKLIPSDYRYPFGKGGFTIKKYRVPKIVMSNAEIKSVVDFKDFETPEQEYARDIWLLLYRCNGINYADMLRLKWSKMKNNYFIFTRMKTENTRKTNIKPIIVAIEPNIQALLDKVGNRNSSYVLGLLEEGYGEKDFNYKKDWERFKLNNNLKFISEKLNLSVDLRLKTSRDCFASTLKRAGKKKETIGEMMGHSDDYISTSHYLADLDADEIREINECLF
jgi:integrase